jgi:hypothetical protein
MQVGLDEEYEDGSLEQHRAVQWHYYIYLLTEYGLRGDYEVTLVTGKRADLVLSSRYDESKKWAWEIKPDKPRYHIEGPQQLAGYLATIGGSPGGDLPPARAIQVGELTVSAYSGPEPGMIYYKARSQREREYSYSPVPGMEWAVFWTLVASGALSWYGMAGTRWNTSGAYGP